MDMATIEMNLEPPAGPAVLKLGCRHARTPHSNGALSCPEQADSATAGGHGGLLVVEVLWAITAM